MQDRFFSTKQFCFGFFSSDALPCLCIVISKHVLLWWKAVSLLLV